MPDEQRHRLAAIMFSDIVGYTALMGRDENQALKLLRKNTDLQKTVIDKFQGDLIKEIGDGILACFQSTSDAVYCAIEIQDKSFKNNIPLRIGIHEGEVVFKDGDVIGDGVNVASRLEEIAEEGGIIISETVYKNIKNKPRIQAIFVEERCLKNVDDLVRIYQVRARNKQSEKSKINTAAQSTESSIAVLPFVNMSNDPEQEYFCDGLSEEILNVLAKLNNLKVAARTSSFSFRNKGVDIAEIGQKLKVNTVLEGSVRKSGDRLRITAQLINVADGFHMWSESFNRTIEDIFIIQDEIAIAIVEHLKLKLLKTEKAKIVKRRTTDPEAFNLYLKGRYFYNKRTLEDSKRSIKCFEMALEKDPSFALAYAGLSDTYGTFGFYHWMPFKEAGSKMKDSALRGLDLDDSIGETHTSYANYLCWYEQRWDEAEQEYIKAMQLSPSDIEAHHMYAHVMELTGRFDDAINEMKKAMELEPLSAILNSCMGNVMFFAGLHEKAIEQFQESIELDPEFPLHYFWLGRAYLQIEEFQMAIDIFKKGLDFPTINASVLGGLGLAYCMAGRVNDALKVLDQLTELSEKQTIDLTPFAYVYIGLNNKERALEYLEKSLKIGDMYKLYLPIDPVFKPLHSDPRFKKLLKRLGHG
jgi:TolB-like protein/Tfp pilus assembly protein PilF